MMMMMMMMSGVSECSPSVRAAGHADYTPCATPPNTVTVQLYCTIIHCTIMYSTQPHTAHTDCTHSHAAKYESCGFTSSVQLFAEVCCGKSVLQQSRATDSHSRPHYWINLVPAVPDTILQFHHWRCRPNRSNRNPEYINVQCKAQLTPYLVALLSSTFLSFRFSKKVFGQLRS